MADGSEQQTPRLKGWMIVALVGIVALAAVGITALIVSHSSSSTTTSTTQDSSTATTATTVNAPSSTAAPPPTTTSASLAAFVGTWSMHDGGLVIAASGAGAITVPGVMYGGCGQTAQIQVSPASATTALATITAIQPPSCTGVAGGFNPSGGGGPDEELSTGSTFTIIVASPGVQTSWGINYCDQAHAAQEACGA